MKSISLKTKKAFTLAEALIVMIVLGCIIVVCMKTLKPDVIKKDAYEKVGAEIHNELALAMTNTIVNYTVEGRLSKIKSASGVYSITDTSKAADFVSVFKKSLKISRKPETSTTPTGYGNAFTLRNGVFVAIQLYGNCTTTTTTYSSQYKDSVIDEYDTCGAIYYDVNGDELPNGYGQDRYVIAFDLNGIR